ncbi:alpha/beta fold hydrolase [Acinetobacter sp. V102_4]|uniref:alpha/beta fold hydrolase n=1 Tax=Acinetobacter sp. V102_4 TaxID=3072984 RepID=UPI00287BD913|nr:alpha/beta fold hydrolase [Acinetobacter sp. V102_4]MDS7930913.1 alpha/beta fold hydrolase [Acinetobacter sp. V102_4]
MQQPAFFVSSSTDIQIAVYTWGDEPTHEHPREILIFAHGFPDRALFWEKVAKQLENDFYVVAFDMRGCAESTHIKGYKHYQFEHLVNDLYAVIDAVSPNQKIHLVGHDWGGIYGWDAIRDSEGKKRIASFTTMSPSLEQVGLYLRRRLLKPTPKNLWQLIVQLWRNSLMTFFTLPILPELLWYSGLGTLMMKWMITYYESDVHYQKNIGVEGDAIRYLGIYRANLLQRVLFAKEIMTDVPVHTLMALRDPFLPPYLFDDSKNWASNSSESTVNAAHWAPLSQPKVLADNIRNFLLSINNK